MSSPTSDISPSTIGESFPGSRDLARLGEELIGQLERFEDDICSAWMAHHLARLMQDAKGATGESKTEAEDRCRTAILALWRHRTELNEPRPLQSADEIIRAIRGLYDSEGRWFFFLDEPEKPADQMIELIQIYRSLDDMKSVTTLLGDSNIFFAPRDELNETQQRVRDEVKEALTSLGRVADEMAKTL